MTRLAKWWRSIGGLAAACLLALFAVGPVADAVVCQADAPAVEAAYAPDKAGVAAPGDPKSHPAEAGICVHGHCHHAGPLLAAPFAAAHAVASADARQPYPADRALASIVLAGPERPPRA